MAHLPDAEFAILPWKNQKQNLGAFLIHINGLILAISLIKANKIVLKYLGRWVNIGDKFRPNSDFFFLWPVRSPFQQSQLYYVNYGDSMDCHKGN